MASFFGGSSSNSSGDASKAKIMAAETELDMVTDMFNRLVDVCHSKCIDKRYDSADLSKGDSLCIDRCVEKYFSVNAKVGEHMQQLGKSGAFAGAR